MDSPLQRLYKDTSDAAHLVSEGGLPGDILTAADDKFFGIYQDLVHQNPGTHMYGGIEKNGKNQQIWKKPIFLPIQF